MIEMGLIDEVKRLKDQGHTFNIIGYREINDYLDGLYTKEEAIQEIKTVTRRFAKRQETFFKNQMQTHMIDNDQDALEQIIKELDGFYV